MALSIHDCLLQIARRAERAPDEKLIATFVDAEPLLASVSTNDNQVIYGRRGTGKTHILKYLTEAKADTGDITMFMDLRSIGSNGSIYGDQSRTLAQRATPLLLDVLQGLHEELLRVAVDNAEQYDLSRTGPLLDDLASSISEVHVVGTTTNTIGDSVEKKTGSSANWSTSISDMKPSFSAGSTETSEESASQAESTTRSGTETYYVNFGTVQTRLKAVLDAFSRRRVWILLDEWSEIPLELQPYLADLIRRCVIPIGQVTIKIAAIEHRTNLILRADRGGYLGLELGADVGADVNLDDFMVFDNDSDRSKAFFSNLLFKHYRATDGLSAGEGPQSSAEFISELFTQVTAFDEFVRATEGVPRDAVYLASTVARKAYNRKVSVEDVRGAARDWYQNDKSTMLKADASLGDLLHWIIKEVIAHRKARAFLLRSTAHHPLIDTLFDARLLHILKRNISSHDNPGVRYDVYKLDYGCYVDLISTSKAPGGLLPTDTDEGAAFIEVPPDDYRAIRRAILDLSDFDKAMQDRSPD